MPITKIYDAVHQPTEKEKNELVDFLYENLDQYGDEKRHIKRCIDYATKEIPSFGGFVMVMYDGDTIASAVVINHTGMGGYIPENILVYIATHKNQRGKGVGTRLMQEALNYAKGDVALHVEHNNPAKHLYERFGFKNPYLEMRLKR